MTTGTVDELGSVLIHKRGKPFNLPKVATDFCHHFIIEGRPQGAFCRAALMIFWYRDRQVWKPSPAFSVLHLTGVLNEKCGFGEKNVGLYPCDESMWLSFKC